MYQFIKQDKLFCIYLNKRFFALELLSKTLEQLYSYSNGKNILIKTFEKN